MNIVAKWKIMKYCDEYPNARGALLSWNETVKRAKYTKPEDVQAEWGRDSTLNDTVAVFNMKGNRYRLVVRINYTWQHVFVRWFGTHAEYNKIDALSI